MVTATPPICCAETFCTQSTVNDVSGPLKLLLVGSSAASDWLPGVFHGRLMPCVAATRSVRSVFLMLRSGLAAFVFEP